MSGQINYFITRLRQHRILITFHTYFGNPCNWFLMVSWIILIKFIFQLKRELRNLLPYK